MFERLDVELKWVLDTEVTPCYWGDDWVILHNMQDSKATQLIQEERTKGSSPFLDLQKWSQDIRPTYRLTWVILWGLPPLVWEQESMGKVLAEVGELVQVDDMVEQRRRVDVARILVRTHRPPGIQSAITAIVDGVPHVLHVVEDMSGLGAWPNMKTATSGLPPSPFSTEPNSPAFDDAVNYDDDSPFALAGDSPDNLDGPSSDGRHRSSIRTRRDHWVKTIGRRCLDRIFSEPDVVASLPIDSKILNPLAVDPVVSTEPSVGQKLLKRTAFNELPNLERHENNQYWEAQQGKLHKDIPEDTDRCAGRAQNTPMLVQENVPPPLDQSHFKNHTPPHSTRVDEGGGGFGPLFSRPNLSSC